MLCSEWCLVKQENRSTTIIPLRCRCWTCEECAPLRQAQLVQEGLSGQPNIFITLTSRYIAGGSPDAAARRLAWAWRIIRAEFLRAHGKNSLPFLCVFEKTKQGWPHLHIIGRCQWIDQAWLSKRMGRLTGSPITYVERPPGQYKVAFYISKYLAKNPHRFIGTKRYWRSQDYLDPTRATLNSFIPIPDTWVIVREHWKVLASRYERRGVSVTWSRGEAIMHQGPPP